MLRRLEARGEISGGRFVSGFAGEQFALPEAATLLRRHREDRDQALLAVCGSDPLNLVGLIVPGERVPALPGNRILYRGGAAVGITSVCSASPLVLQAACEQAADDGAAVLVEATSNQVDQFGGYTGMRPADFRDLVHGIADRLRSLELVRGLFADVPVGLQQG